MNKKYYQEAVLKQCQHKYPVRVILEVESVQTATSEEVSTTSSITGGVSEGQYNISKINDLLYKCQRHLIKLSCQSQSARKLSGCFNGSPEQCSYIHPSPSLNSEPAWRNPTYIRKISHFRHRLEIPSLSPLNPLSGMCKLPKRNAVESNVPHSPPIWKDYSVPTRNITPGCQWSNADTCGPSIETSWAKAQFEPFCPEDDLESACTSHCDTSQKYTVKVTDGIVSNCPLKSGSDGEGRSHVASVMSARKKRPSHTQEDSSMTPMKRCRCAARCCRPRCNPWCCEPQTPVKPDVSVTYDELHINSSTSSQSNLDRMIDRCQIPPKECDPPIERPTRRPSRPVKDPWGPAGIQQRRKQFLSRCKNLYRSASSTCSSSSSDTSLGSLEGVDAIYCRRCMRFVPCRSVHCPICNICIEKWYLHSFLLGTCIGSENIGYYMMFLFWSSLGLLGSAIYLIYYIGRQYPDNSTLCAFLPFKECQTPRSSGDAFLSILLICFLCLSLYCYLCFVYYLDLVRRDKVSYEDPTETNSDPDYNLYRVFGSPWYLAFFCPFKNLSEKEKCCIDRAKCVEYLKLNCYMKTLIARRCEKMQPYEVRICKPKGQPGDKSGDGKNEENKAGEEKSGEEKTGGPAGEEKKDGETKGEEKKDGETKGEEKKDGETKGEEKKDGETKGEEKKDGETKGEEKKDGEAPGDGKKNGEDKGGENINEEDKHAKAKKMLEDARKKREEKEAAERKRREEYLQSLRDIKELNKKIDRFEVKLEDTEDKTNGLLKKREKMRKKDKQQLNLDQSFIRKMTN